MHEPAMQEHIADERHQLAGKRGSIGEAGGNKDEILQNHIRNPTEIDRDMDGYHHSNQPQDAGGRVEEGLAWWGRLEKGHNGSLWAVISTKLACSI